IIVEVELQVEHPGCNGNDGSIQAVVEGATGPLSYQWIPAAPDAPLITGLSSGEYAVSITGEGVCTATASTVLEQDEDPFELEITHGDISCAGAGDGWATVVVTNAPPDVTYSW